MSTEKLDTRVRQGQIVQAALDLIGREGPGGLSIARVARRVNVVPSALYRHFPNKEAIVDAVLGGVQQTLADNVRAARGGWPRPLEQLQALFARHLALITDNPGIPRLVFSDEVFAGNRARRLRMSGAVERYLDAVTGMVRDGQRRGEIRADLDGAAVALLFLGVVQAAATLSRIGDARRSAAGRAEKAWAALVAGIAAD